MDDGEVAEPRAPRYPGEDTSETSEREIRGWYCYGLAAEVFAVCGVGSFLPVTLEQLARDRGVWFNDRTTSCMAKVADEAGTATALLLSRKKEEHNQCIIHLFGGDITTSSFAMYTFSLAVLVQALSLISFSSVADYGNYRKKFLLGFGFTGAITSMLFLLVVPKIYIVAPLLVIIGVTCLGSSNVILNSFLPLLVLNHSQARRKETMAPPIAMANMSPEGSYEDEPPGYESTDGAKAVPSKLDSPQLGLQNSISSKGVGIGYAAAVFVQIISILVLYVMSKLSNSSTLGLRLVLLMVGVWWFCFTIPVSLWMRSRPGPPLTTALSKHTKVHTVIVYLSFAWGSVWKTVKVAVKLRQMSIFLIAWFILSDAVATVSGTAILFARTELKMGTVPIAILSITATSSGIAGAFLWPIISRRYNLQTNRTIVCCVALMEIIPLYGLMGYLPFIKAWGVGGLQQYWEIYPLGFVHGFVMGGLSSYCRSFYGLLIPPGSEAAFYALYAITDKGSSAIGPAVVGVIVDATGTIRPAFFFLAVLIALPLPLIWMVDVEKGKEDAARMARFIGKSGDANERFAIGEDEEHEAEGLIRDHD
ncbi:Autophagy-related 22-1 [Hyphodiscus hymeniophilus]|uniref:Autophagy-related protein n=1 Tax=Hyphodiscus hymeniophilus TaxID=353542 RepID=A0A9P6VJN8_9HELO|nr:Autophagy-related 22-1 [Hyphodiscus hymeniophilus]